MKGRIEDAARAMGGKVITGGIVTTGDPRASYRGAALDSRKAGGGALFFAVPGAQTDGHRFVRAAFESGAAAAVVHRDDVDAPAGAILIRVDDTTEALHALTRAVRETTPEKLVGITGSAGKTTTKELLAAMLARRFRVAKTPGNLNNLYGFPLALLGIAADSQWMVAEMGMSTPGELAGVSRLARPDAVLLTNVGAAHLENFPSIRAIADAKAGVMAGLVEGGLVIANADDPEVVGAVERHRPAGPTLWYSERDSGAHGSEQATTNEATADRLLRQHPGSNRPRVRARDIRPRGARRTGYRFTLELDDEAGHTHSQVIELPLHGRYNVSNCLAAAATAWALGVELTEIASAVLEVEAPAGRGIVLRFGDPARGGTVVVDDSYNSNPAALELALESAAEFARELDAKRHWAVLGDMLELGPEAPALHRRGGTRAAELGFAPLAAVGALGGELLTGAWAAGADRDATHHFADAAACSPWARQALAGGDLVLVKGSRGIGLEAVVESLCDAATRAPATRVAAPEGEA